MGIERGGLTFLLRKRFPREPSLSPEQRHDREEELRHTIQYGWKNFVNELKIKGANLFRVRPAIEGPVEIEGFLCLAEFRGKWVRGHRIVPIVQHEGEIRLLGRGSLGTSPDGFIYNGCVYPRLSEQHLLEQVVNRGPDNSGKTTKAFFLPFSWLNERFSHPGQTLEELEARQKQLKVFKRQVKK